MSAYYEANGGDRDMQDLMQIRHEELVRSGKSHLANDKYELDAKAAINSFKRKIENDKKEKISHIGSFESYTKGFGRRILENQGWKEGKAVGMEKRSGLKEALDASDGKMPFDRTGFGYNGLKVDRDELIQKQRKVFDQERRDSQFFIGSKFDEANKEDTLLVRHESTIKYRKS